MKYPIGIQDFASLRGDGYAYVDKTRFIWQLVNTGRYYFLSRPRRFGKSLLLSTMKSYFLGQKELFHGLALEQLEKEWTAYPVLYLDINSGNYQQPGDLRERLEQQLTLWEAEYGEGDTRLTPASRFINVIRAAVKKTGQRVVILVDEYDKPMLQTIGNEELQTAQRNELKAFYSVLKTMDGYIKFAFLTGVTKFSKVSVFSDLNNLMDISMDERFVEICGMTEQELHDNFEEGIGELAANNHMTREACVDKLRERYDGYHFTVGAIGIYNPFSVLGALNRKKFSDYWFETGTPSFLVEVLKRTNYNLFKLSTQAVTTDVLNCIDPLNSNPLPVIYQSGYLTLNSYDEEENLYRLDFPNGEVREGFLTYLLPAYTPQDQGGGRDYVAQIRRAAQAGQPEEMMQLLQDFFDTGDYHVVGKKELYFQNAMYIIFRLLGLRAQVELATARGRIDLTIETADYIYVVEIKLDGTAEEALQQIEEKGYARKFAGDPRKLYKIGANFASETRSVDGWKISFSEHLLSE